MPLHLRKIGLALVCGFALRATTPTTDAQLRSLAAQMESQLRANPDSVSANLSIAAVYLKLGSPGRAIPFAKRAAREQPNNNLAKLTLADALLECGRSTEAFPFFHDLLTSSGLSPGAEDEIWFGVAKSAFAISRQSARWLQETPSAAKLWTKLQQAQATGLANSENADDPGWSALLGETNKSPRVEFQRSIIFEGIGITALNHLLQQNPVTVRRLSLAASIFIWINEYSQAIRLLTKAVKMEPEDGRLWAALGKAQWHATDFSGAAGSLRKAIALHAADTEVEFIMGDVLSRGGHPRESIRYLERSLALDPNSSLAHSSLARSYTEIGDYQSAIRELLAIPKAKRTAAVFYRLYRAYLRTGRRPEAETALVEYNHLKSVQARSSQPGAN